MHTTLRTIRVRGTLAKLLKRRTFKAAVRSPQEAIRFLLANYPELEGYMRPRFFHINVGGRVINEESIGLPAGFHEDINITPAICGAGGDGENSLTQIFAGVALIALSIFVPFVAPVLLPLGIGLTLTGVAGLLSPVTPDRPESSDARDSYSFSNVQQTSREGPPVPLVYGEIITGSIVLSVNIERDDEKLGTGDGEGIFEPGIGDNTYNLAERYPGICWGYYSEVYFEFDYTCPCVGPPNTPDPEDCVGDLSRSVYFIMIPSFGIYPNASGFYESASVPTAQIVNTRAGQTGINGCGGVRRGYDFSFTHFAPRCASETNDDIITWQATILDQETYGRVPVGYRVWQGPAKLFDGTTPENIPFRLIASTAETGFTIPTETFSSNYPNNPFE